MSAVGNSNSSSVTYNIKIDDENDEHPENDLQDYFQAGKPAIVFCVNGEKRMFEFKHGETPPFIMSLQCIRQVIRNHIFASIKCYCAVIIVGCNKSHNAINLKNIAAVSPLEYIGVKIIKDIDQVIADVEESRYEDNYGYGQFSLSDGLWCAITMHANRKGNIRKKLVVFSNEDDPYKGNRLERVRTIAKVADFSMNQTEFQVIGIGENFDYKKCYKEMVELSGNWCEEAPYTLVEAMVAACGTGRHRHVALANIPFYLSDDLALDVSINYLARSVKKPTAVPLCKATNERVTSRVTSYNVNTGEVVRPEAIVQSEQIGGKQLVFKGEEVKKINTLGERRLKLLGFKPRDSISLELHVKPCAFIYPSEVRLKGGAALFSALLERCLARQMLPICTFCPRPTSSIRFVALVPQAELREKDGRQIVPPGFVLVVLPFGDEVRDWDETCTGKHRATPEQVELMAYVVKKLSFKYQPDNFPSPMLTKHWAGVEAVALQLPAAEQVRDETIPDYSAISARLGDLPQRMRDEVYSEGYVPEQPVGRKPADDSVDVAAVEDLARRLELEKLRANQLKSYLKAVGLGNGLSKIKKDDLVKKIYSYLKINR